MNGQDSAFGLDGAIASYRSIVERQTESIADLETWLKDRSASDEIYQGIASAVYPLLASNRARLLEARRTGIWPHDPPAPASWGTITWARTSAATVSVTGLGPDGQERYELHAQNGDIRSIEKFVSLLANAVCIIMTLGPSILRLDRIL